MCQKNDWLHGTQGKDVPFVSIPMYQYSNYINNNNNKKTTPVIKHVSCGYSCCCSVGRLVVTPPISRSSRSGLSSHVSFRSLVLTWCVRRRRGREWQGIVIYDIYDLWRQLLKMRRTAARRDTTFENAPIAPQEGQPSDCLSWMRWQFLLLDTPVQVIRPGIY